MEIFKIIMIIAVVLFNIGYLLYVINRKGLRGLVLNLILEAEQTKLENQEKMDYVIDKFILMLPIPFRLLITRSLVNKFIQKIFDEIKEILKYKG